MKNRSEMLTAYQLEQFRIKKFKDKKEKNKPEDNSHQIDWVIYQAYQDYYFKE